MDMRAVGKREIYSAQCILHACPLDVHTYMCMNGRTKTKAADRGRTLWHRTADSAVRSVREKGISRVDRGHFEKSGKSRGIRVCAAVRAMRFVRHAGRQARTRGLGTWGRDACLSLLFPSFP